jgi:hypothetical protein
VEEAPSRRRAKRSDAGSQPVSGPSRKRLR